MPQGYIKKGIGGFYYVQCQDGQLLECKAKGIFRKRKISPVAGDWVTVEQEQGGNVIAEIHSRKNLFIRPPIANLDVLFVVASTVQPVPSTLVLDKLTAIAVDKGVQPVMVFTKDDLQSAQPLADIYRHAGFPVVIVNQQTGEGLDQIRQHIGGNLCAFCGNSGVGKSTLLNALVPELSQQTGSISHKLGRGRHTTREVEIFQAFGGRIADTPGFASLDTERACYISKENLQYAFPEFEPYIPQCRFTGCAHRAEKDCAVVHAVQEGEIEQSRYDSYAAMYDEVKSIKDWELH